MNTSNKEITLSVCIPTYNRSNDLIELVNSILTIDRKDINIFITNNCSTDDTVDKIDAIRDNRVSIVTNKEPLPPLNNMIQAIFNGKGKYIFYCNDRDIIHPKKLENLIDFLEKNEFAFVHAKQEHISNKYEVRIFEPGYDSLIHQRCTHHPSGMIFNGNFLKKYLTKEKYFEYLKFQYTYSYLMRDILQFGASAIWDYGCWNQRDASYLKKNKGRSNNTKTLYFYPEVSFNNVGEVFRQVFEKNDYKLSPNQRDTVALYIGEFFLYKLISYKYYMMSDQETAHYNIHKKFITLFEMNIIVWKYCNIVDKLLDAFGFPKETIRQWRKKRLTYFMTNVKENLYIDKKIILRRIK